LWLINEPRLPLKVVDGKVSPPVGMLEVGESLDAHCTIIAQRYCATPGI
jgi:hypothetical protein